MAENRRSVVGSVIAVMAVLIFLSSVSGCVPFGEDFRMPIKGAIKIGATTKPQVEQMYGKPYKKGLDNGSEAWSYFYTRHNLLWWKTHTKELYVIFDRNDRVKSFSSSGNFPGQ